MFVHYKYLYIKCVGDIVGVNCFHDIDFFKKLIYKITKRKDYKGSNSDINTIVYLRIKLILVQ